jgi:hypothetical protein
VGPTVEERALVSVAAAFADYLSGADRYGGGLIGALDAAGLAGQAALLHAFHVDGAVSADATPLGPAWTGQRCAIGLTPPAEAEGGDLWFDPVEVTAMILVPWPDHRYSTWPAQVQQRMTRFSGWLAITRAFAWQVRGWASATGHAGIPPELPDAAPATGLSGLTVDAYAGYFGKLFSTRFAWRAVAEMGALGELLWPDTTLEFTGFGNEEEVEVHRRDQALIPDYDDDDDDFFEEQDDCVRDDWKPLPGVAFRTRVESQLGLIRDRSGWERR